MQLPTGFHTITPYIFVEQADQFVQFLLNAFDGHEIGRTLAPNGTIANAQVRIGTNALMVSEATENYPAMPAAYYLYVDDADAAMDKALGYGAKLEMEVEDMPYGDRQGGVIDPFGNIWWISQRLETGDYF